MIKSALCRRLLPPSPSLPLSVTPADERFSQAAAAAAERRQREKRERHQAEAAGCFAIEISTA